MGPTNTNIICLAGSNRSTQTSQLVWWGLVLVETLLFMRFFLELLRADPTNILVSLVSESTNFIVYPIAAVLLSNTSEEGLFAWMLIIAAIAYLVLAIAIAKVLDASRPIRSRIGLARAISRKKYSR